VQPLNLPGGIDLDGNSADPVSSPAVSVIIPAFSSDRWDGLRKVVAAVRAQTVKVAETVVVIDHNPELMAKAVRELPGVTTVANEGIRGASGARNTGAAASRGELLVFLDDDVVAAPNWLESLVGHFKNPAVVGVGGRLEPLWQTRRPWWFPPEFDWAIGCSYLGMPESTTPVRNVWSGNMVIRRTVFDAVDGFRKGFGKVDIRSRPEDTDLCLRTAEYNGGGIWIYEPGAIASHHVPAGCTTFRHFLRRCYYEGQGKAALVSFNGSTESISEEREYTRRLLSHSIMRGMRETARGEASGMARNFAIVAGLSCAAAGFFVDHVVKHVMARHADLEHKAPSSTLWRANHNVRTGYQNAVPHKDGEPR
jgi:cellulose synthase/poly-beta-1,6-N-acetylglucosamine synthase-like glycosyltransferase